MTTQDYIGVTVGRPRQGVTMIDYKGTKSDMICLPPGKTGNPLCIQDGKQCSRVNLSQFLLKAASTTSSFSLNRERPLLNQHYRPSHTILGSVPPSFFNINFSVRPQRARVLHNKIAISLRPHPKRYKAITVKPGQANPPRFH